MTVIGNLPHDAVDHERVRPVLLARDDGERFGHERALVFSGRRAMIAQHGHRRIAGVAVEDREFERMYELAVALRVIPEFTQFALGHHRTSRGATPPMLPGIAGLPDHLPPIKSLH